MTGESASMPDPRSRVAAGDVLAILGTDLKNLGAAIQGLGSDASLHGAVNVAHLALALVTEEIGRLPPVPPTRTGPRIFLAMQYMRAAEFTWVAAVRSMLQLHRAEGAANTRAALELLGAVFFILRLSNGVDDEKLLDIVGDSQQVGRRLATFVRDSGDTEGLKWLKSCKGTCTDYGAHGGIGRLIGLTRPVTQKGEGRTFRLDAEVSYTDLDPASMPSMLSWLTSVAARSVNLLADEALIPAGLTISPAMTHARTTLLAAAAKMARAHPIRHPSPPRSATQGN